MSQVVVVTDSTAYLPADLPASAEIGVVPLQISLGGAVGLEGRDIGPAEVAAALVNREGVSTSRPTPGEFARAYAAAAVAGAAAVVSVHISGELSGTVGAARLAAPRAPLEVHVVDSRTAAMGLGFAVLAAWAAAREGAPATDVADRAAATAARTRTYFSVSTLDHLRRGGRVGAAVALLGSALAVKPILHVTDGRIAVREKVRTAGRATARLAELALAEAADRAVEVAVHHLAAPQAAATLVDRLTAELPRLQALYLSEVGAAIGAHLGPGAVGVVVCPC